MNDKAKAGLAEYMEKRRAGEIEPPQRMNPLEAAQTNPKSKTAAIKAACWDCVGGDHTTNWRDEVRYCPVTQCGLYLVRPFQPSKT